MAINSLGVLDSVPKAHGSISYSLEDTEAKVDWGSFCPLLAGIRVKIGDFDK